MLYRERSSNGDCRMKEVHTITRVSPFSGKTNTMEIEFDNVDFQLWRLGVETIQNAMPYLTADEREFIMTGITAEEWEKAFGED